MQVVWNGLPTHPGGRQLFIEEEVRRAAIVQPDRVLLSRRKAISVTNDVRATHVVATALANGPQTAPDLAEALAWPLSKARAVLHRMHARGQVRVVDTRTVQKGGRWSRTIERVYNTAVER